MFKRTALQNNQLRFTPDMSNEETVAFFYRNFFVFFFFFIEHIKKTMASRYTYICFYFRLHAEVFFKLFSNLLLSKGSHFLLDSASNLSTAVCYFGGGIRLIFDTNILSQ